MRSMDEEELRHYYELYVDMIYRLCFSYLKNKDDAQDALQETFLKLVKQQNHFDGEEHVKAWLIVTATNQCKTMLTHWWHKREEYDETTEGTTERLEQNEVLDAVMSLPVKYKTVVFMYYYEGYNSSEIAKILNKPAGTVRSLLHVARSILKKQLEDQPQKGVRIYES